MRRAEIADQNRCLLERQRELRVAADVVADAWMVFPEVQAIAVIGSVVKPLWKEVRRPAPLRRDRGARECPASRRRFPDSRSRVLGRAG
jgi:hypothetical protein